MIDQLLCLHRTMTSKHGYDVTVQYVFYFLNENSQGILELGVEFTKGGKLENPEKNCLALDRVKQQRGRFLFLFIVYALP